MGLFDTNDEGDISGVSNVAYAANIASLTANQPSMEESLGNVVTKFAPLTLMSVYNSFYNDAVAVGNLFGGDAKPVKLQQYLQDQGWDDLSKYYSRHQQGIDAAGLLTGTILSGMAGIGALNVIRAGRLGLTAARATNLFMTPTEDLITAARSSIENSSSLFTSITADKVKAIAGGFRDQAVASLAFETAAAVAMRPSSPLLEKDSWQNMVSDMTKGVIFGTVAGGGLETFSVLSKIRKAIYSADDASKASGDVTYAMGNNLSRLPNGESLAGDKAALAASDAFNLPVTPGNALSQARATQAQRFAENRIKETVRALGGTGNDEFADAFTDSVITGRKSNLLSTEQVADTFAGLQRIAPVGDDSLVVPTTDQFYVNKITNLRRDAQGNTLPPQLSDVLTPAPIANADTSRRFMLRDPATSVKIAVYDDPFVQQNGTVTRLYDNAQDAFNDGHDVFINQQRQAIVTTANNLQQIPLVGHSRVLTQTEERSFNTTGLLPKGSAPLYSAPSIVNVKTNEILEGDIIKSLGDYAGESKVRIVKSGVQFGNQDFSPQTVDSVLDSSTPVNDAMSRYIWYANRGIQGKGQQIFDGTTFATADLPALEAMYYEGVKSGNWGDYIQKLEKRGITFSSGETLPTTEQQMLSKIQLAKDDFIRDVYARNSGISAEEIARRANVSPSYLENGLKANKTEDFMRPHSDISDINHVQLQYNIGNTARQDGYFVKGAVAANYRIQMFKDTVEAAGAEMFGDMLPGFQIKYNSSDVKMSGTKPGFLTWTNADYGTAENAAERMGRNSEMWTQRMKDQWDSLMSPHYRNLRNDPEMFNELNAFLQVRRSTGEHFVSLPEALQQQYMPDMAPGGMISVLEKSLVKDRRGNILDWNSDYKPAGFFDGATKQQLADAALNPHPVGLKTFYELSPKVADFENAAMSHNDMIITATNRIYAALGMDRELPLGRLHAPAIDTGKYPYLAIVKPRAGSAFADGSTSVITAATEDGLKQKMSMIDPNSFDIYLKDQIKDRKQIQGEYDYSRNFNTGLAREEMRRKGVLNDALPSANPEALIKDYIDFGSRQVYRVTRDYGEALNDQFFTELRAVGEMYTATATSQTKWWSTMFEKAADNPYDSVIKTALGIKDSSYPLWRQGQEVAESYASNAFNMAKSAFIDAKKGNISFDAASAINEANGLGNPYARAVDKLSAFTEMASQLPPKYLLSKFVNVMNSIQAMTSVKLDVFQSFITAISAPIMIASELSSARRYLLNLPGTNGAVQLPGVTKLLAASMGDIFNSAVRNEWMPKLRQMNVIKDYIGDYFKLTNEMTLPIGAAATETGITAQIGRAVDLAAKFTGAQYAEDFGRYWAAMTAKRLFEEAGQSGQELIDNMITFVNRVHGNYVASQRPIAFQGPIGAAATLFQTYQLNLFQQLLRYVGDKDYKSLGIFSALQGSIFGVQGLPGIQMINQALIGNAASNPYHKDLYGTTINAFDKDLGDWILYGAVSNVAHMGLYSRGDINPRSLTLISLNPAEWPAVNGSISFMSNLYNTIKKMANGGDIWNTFTQGLEHNGLSRPLSGLAQLMQGYTTTGGGDLIAAVPSSFQQATTQGWSDLQIAANYGRILGARPLDEAVAMDQMYRNTAYQAKDRSRMEELGAEFKTHAMGNAAVPGNVVTDFASKYAASGGMMQNFAKFVINNTKEANTAAANQIFLHLSKPLAQQSMLVMGGRMLPDYMMNPAPATPGTMAPQLEAAIP